MFLYCIKHGRMVKAEPARLCPMGHPEEVTLEYEGVSWHEIDYCCFDQGWATCPPADQDPWLMESYDWMKWVDQARPDDIEILISDLNALSLRLDLEEMSRNGKENI